MGRANVYLPDDLERRVKAARIPVSEVCQQALLAAVEAAEAEQPWLSDAAADLFRRGAEAGERWARAASLGVLLALVRDQRVEQIPEQCLPDFWFSLTDDLTTAWEAGFAEGARGVARSAVSRLPGVPAAQPAAGDTPPPAVEPGPPLEPGPAEAPGDAPGDAPLGDGSASSIGTDDAGRRVAFDPHAAVRQGKSPLFAVLGSAGERSRLALSIGQDAACRGAAVVVLDLSGQVTPHARGLGRNVRLPVPGSAPGSAFGSAFGSAAGSAAGMPGLDALFGSPPNLRGLWDLMAGLSAASGSAAFSAAGPSSDLVTPGYVTVLPVPLDRGFGLAEGRAGLAGLAGAVNALRALAGLGAQADHPRLLLADLPEGTVVPAQLAAALRRLVRTARQNGVALGLTASSADAVAVLGGSGALLSTVFAFPTSSPAEAARLRDLIGPGAPVLVSPPGFVPRAGDELWCTMRDLSGRVGQVRLDAS